MWSRALKSGENVVVLLRLCGNVFAVSRRGTGLRIRVVATFAKHAKPPDQSAAIKLLQRD